MTPATTVVRSSATVSRAVGSDAGDAELVAAVRAGDERAFERLYERYHRRIAAYIYGMVNDYGRAEDIAQDVFMSALRRMRQTDRPLAFKPWVYEIAKNACIDQFRRSRRGEEVSYDGETGLDSADHGRLVAPGVGPELAAEQKLQLDHLRGAFGGLSETHHQVLVMRELEGLSYREIGERLGMSRPAVESTLFRARRRLSEEYDELVSGRRCLRVQGIIAGAVTTPLGARDERRLAVHTSHCQSCRRHARGLGLGAAVAARARVAAFLPLPAVLRHRIAGADVTGPSGTPLATVTQWSGQMTSAIDPSMASWFRAAAAAATVAVVGVGASAGTSHLSLGGSSPAPVVGRGHLPAAAPTRHTSGGRSGHGRLQVRAGAVTVSSTGRAIASSAGPTAPAAAVSGRQSVTSQALGGVAKTVTGTKPASTSVAPLALTHQGASIPVGHLPTLGRPGGPSIVPHLPVPRGTENTIQSAADAGQDAVDAVTGIVTGK